MILLNRKVNIEKAVELLWNDHFDEVRKWMESEKIQGLSGSGQERQGGE